MNTKDVVTQEAVERDYIPRAAARVARGYKQYGVGVDDCSQEILAWYYAPQNQKKVKRWLGKSPQQLVTLYYALCDAARSYAEKEKAHRCGYEVDDVHWYSPSQVEALLPLALDSTFDGTGMPDYDRESASSDAPRAKKNPAEGNDLTAMVMDVRRALKALDEWVEMSLRLRSPGEALYDSAVHAIVSYLGNRKPVVGDRKVISNEFAQYKTKTEGDNYYRKDWKRREL